MRILALVACGLALALAGCGGGSGGSGNPVSVATPAPTPTPLPPLFTTGGMGNTVFDMPTYVTRIRIQGEWNRSGTSNFVVKVAVA